MLPGIESKLDMVQFRLDMVLSDRAEMSRISQVLLHAIMDT